MHQDKKAALVKSTYIHNDALLICRLYAECANLYVDFKCRMHSFKAEPIDSFSLCLQSFGLILYSYLYCCLNR